MRHFAFLFLWLPLLACADGYLANPGYLVFEDRMVRDHGFGTGQLRELFAQAERKQSILDIMERPAEKRLSWGEYRDLFVTPARITGGVDFWRQNKQALVKAEARYGVAPEIIVAIIGVETRYGSNMGSYRVLDALATLAFDYPPRASFFSDELEQYLLMTRERHLDPLDLRGSYAGAMGMGQFIPSSYRRWATDFNDDSRVDIWSDPADAIGSVANYFREHGWITGGTVAVPARSIGTVPGELLNAAAELPSVDISALSGMGLQPAGQVPAGEKVAPLALEGQQGPEYWLELQNFYVITRYNRSPLYAMAVWQLSQEIRKGVTP